jgi:AcrR family transcriptional regulator
MPVPLLSREELLERLSRTFRRYGYEGASMTRIAEASGLGKASLYHYFPEGKSQMARAVVQRTIEWFEANVFGPLESNHPPRQRIIAMLDTLHRYFEGGQLACLPALMAMSDDRALFPELLERFFTRWVSALGQTLTDSGLARDIAQRRAYDAVERIYGALILSRAFGSDHTFLAMSNELPDHLLAGAGRSTLWTTRVPRFPSSPMVPSRAG